MGSLMEARPSGEDSAACPLTQVPMNDA